jgi:hypothetical protein
MFMLPSPGIWCSVFWKYEKRFSGGCRLIFQAREYKQGIPLSFPTDPQQNISSPTRIHQSENFKPLCAVN